MIVNLIIPSYYPATIYGGPIFSTYHTCLELAKLEGITVYVSTTNANMTTRLDVETMRWIELSKNLLVKYYNETKINKFSISFLLNVWRDIKQADVVHLQSVFSISTPISLFYARIFKKPVLLSPRGQFGSWCLKNGNRFKYNWLKWLIKPYANNVVWHATAQQERDEIQTLFAEAKVAIISNGIEYELFQKSNVMSYLELLEKFTKIAVGADKVIVSMGRLQKKKGFDILIHAFVDVLSRYSDAKLLIAGQDEGEKENLFELIKEHRLENNIFLIGAINGQDKIDFLANADLFVLPSHNENFGNVFVESLAAGTPIVASKDTPWQEVEQHDCGKWVDNNIEDTAQAILEMLNKDREQMRINSKKFAQKYDWKNIAKKFKETFKGMSNEE